MSRDRFLAECQAFLEREGVENFRAYELCDVGRRKVLEDGSVVTLQAPPRELWPNAITTLLVWEWVRARLGVLVDVSSGYRDPAYNAAVGGASRSCHLVCNAIDALPRGHEPLEVARLILEHPAAHRMGIGVYRTFVHLDTRGVIGREAPARWGVVDGWWR